MHPPCLPPLASDDRLQFSYFLDLNYIILKCHLAIDVFVKDYTLIAPKMMLKRNIWNNIYKYIWNNRTTQPHSCVQIVMNQCFRIAFKFPATIILTTLLIT